MKKHTLLWIFWLVTSVSLLSYFSLVIFYSENKSELLIGESTQGHYQIELQCSACHSEAFSSEDVIQDACVNCHQQELTEARDSHPRKKFTDPREANRLEKIDARYCVSCHKEHDKQATHNMGLTLPEDYCAHCHQDVLENRESHKDLEFNTCASSGCHNYHDNRALYESFLNKHADEPWLKPNPHHLDANLASMIAATLTPLSSTQRSDAMKQEHPSIHAQFQKSRHHTIGMDCVSCHQSPESSDWIQTPNQEQCKSCHENEYEGFSRGKHGMGLLNSSASLKKLISPIEAQLPFTAESQHTQQGCNACHVSHEYDVKTASVEACLSCHADEHSLSFKASPHGQLWIENQKSHLEPSVEVSCATCHLPSVIDQTHPLNTDDHQVVRIEHNQNANLKPNEKMIRGICMNCHGLGFSIDALADPKLIKNNFNGQPNAHIPSIEWATKRNKK